MSADGKHQLTRQAPTDPQSANETARREEDKPAIEALVRRAKEDDVMTEGQINEMRQLPADKATKYFEGFHKKVNTAMAAVKAEKFNNKDWFAKQDRIGKVQADPTLGAAQKIQAIDDIRKGRTEGDVARSVQKIDRDQNAKIASDAKGAQDDRDKRDAKEFAAVSEKHKREQAALAAKYATMPASEVAKQGTIMSQNAKLIQNAESEVAGTSERQGNVERMDAAAGDASGTPNAMAVNAAEAEIRAERVASDKQEASQLANEKNAAKMRMAAALDTVPQNAPIRSDTYHATRIDGAVSADAVKGAEEIFNKQIAMARQQEADRIAKEQQAGQEVAVNTPPVQGFNDERYQNGLDIAAQFHRDPKAVYDQSFFDTGRNA
jgi:hypothetical protein